MPEPWELTSEERAAESAALAERRLEADREAARIFSLLDAEDYDATDATGEGTDLDREAANFFNNVRLMFPFLRNKLLELLVDPLRVLVGPPDMPLIAVRGAAAGSHEHILAIDSDAWELMRDEPVPSATRPTPWVLALDVSIEPDGILPLTLAASNTACRATLELIDAATGSLVGDATTCEIGTVRMSLSIEVPQSPGAYCAVLRGRSLGNDAHLANPDARVGQPDEAWILMFEVRAE